MRADEMTEDQKEKALIRCNRADAIIADYESQYGFELPQPWRDALPRLLLQGLGDPELHLIVCTIARVEFAAGRLEERPVDCSASED